MVIYKKIRSDGLPVKNVHNWPECYSRTCSICPPPTSTEWHIFTMKLCTLSLKTLLLLFFVSEYFTFQICRYYEDNCCDIILLKASQKVIMRINVKRVWWPWPTKSDMPRLAVWNNYVNERLNCPQLRWQFMCVCMCICVCVWVWGGGGG